MGPHVDATNSGAQVKITAPQFMPISFQPSTFSNQLSAISIQLKGLWLTGLSAER